jgi:predicted GH43/DUF377 family glycosyl hydrolase
MEWILRKTLLFSFGEGEYESYGIEDCRVSNIEGTYHLTYTMVSQMVLVLDLEPHRTGKHFEKRDDFSPHNKEL